MLEITTFGELSVRLQGELVTTFASRKAQALLIYLVYTRQPQPREVLADFFWDERGPKQAAGNLRVVLSNLRQVVPAYVDISRHSVAWVPTADHRVDVLLFREHIQAVQDHLQAGAPLNTALAERLRQATMLYQADFLHGFHLRAASGFNDWLAATRQTLQTELSTALLLLATWNADQGSLEPALELTRRLIALDPYNDQANSLLMTLLMRNGERSAAREHYEYFRTLLETELGIQPDHTTQAVYQQLLQTHTAYTSYQPQSATPFIGRTDEMTYVQTLLTTPEVRCVTICGPGGIGKTRLAREVVLQAEQHQALTVLWVTFQTEATQAICTQLLADACAITLFGRKNPEQQIIDYLVDKTALLVLDNAEFALTSVPFLEALLAAAPHIRLLITSRERLQLADEWVVTLQGLSTTTDAHSAPQPGAAQKLFEACAQRIMPAWRPTPAEQHQLATICHLVEGMPLAIEMAAAWLHGLSIADIEAELRRSFDFLVHVQDAHGRHQSLRAVFNASWQLLTPTEQHVVSKLAVFCGSFERRAAEMVCQTALEQLQTLQHKSLLQSISAERYALHGVVRQYALSFLQADKQQWAATLQLLTTYTEITMQDLKALLHSKQALEAVSTIGADLDTIRFVWARALETGAFSTVQVLFDVLSEWHDIRGFYREGIALFDVALTAEVQAVPILYGSIVATCGWFYFRLADYATARQLLEQALHVLDSTTAVSKQIYARCGLAYTCFMAGDHLQGWQAAEQALQQARDTQDTLGCGRALNVLGVIANAQGKFSLAYDVYYEAWSIYQKKGHQWMQAAVAHNLAVVARALGNTAAARDFYQHSLHIRQHLHDRRGMALGLNNLANLSIMEQAWTEARHLFQESLRLYREIGDRAGIALVLHNLGDVATREGQWVAAKTYLQRSLTIRREIQDQRGLAYTLAAFGKVECVLCNWQSAWTHFIEGWKLTLQLNVIPVALEILTGLAELYLVHEQYQPAADILQVVRQHPQRDAQHDQHVAALWQRVTTITVAQQRPLHSSDILTLQDLQERLPAIQASSMYNGDVSWV